MNPQYYKEEEIDAMFAGLGNSTTLQQVTNGENKNLIDGNNFQGDNAGDGATNVNYANFFGFYAGFQADNAFKSNFFGLNAGYQAVDANFSNFFGFYAGTQAVNAYRSNFFGTNAGYQADNANNSNFFGFNTGYQADNANNSNFFGDNAGRSFTGNSVGANNIIIGTNISLPNLSENRINLGGVIFATNTNSDVSGNPKIDATALGRVQIGAVADNDIDRLQVNGTISASPATLPNQVVIKSQLDAKIPKYPINFDKIAVSGTSITFGVGAGPGTKWIDVFKATIDTVLGRTITVINGGISGQSSGGMLTNLPSLIAQSPQIILLEISINDANINGLSYTQSESNYRDMISLCNNANIVPVIFNCWPINVDNITAAGQGTFVESKRTNLCNLSRKLSIELNLQLIDLDLVCAQNVALMFEGLHPNVRGHLFGANVISGEIIKQATIINQLPI